MTLFIPSEHSAKEPSQRKQHSNGDVRRWPTAAMQKSAQVVDGPSGPPAGEWNRPDVVQRHIIEQRVTAQVKLLEVRRINTNDWHGSTVSMIAIPNGPVAVDLPASCSKITHC